MTVNFFSVHAMFTVQGMRNPADFYGARGGSKLVEAAQAPLPAAALCSSLAPLLPAPPPPAAAAGWKPGATGCPAGRYCRRQAHFAAMAARGAQYDAAAALCKDPALALDSFLQVICGCQLLPAAAGRTPQAWPCPPCTWPQAAPRNPRALCPYMPPPWPLHAPQVSEDLSPAGSPFQLLRDTIASYARLPAPPQGDAAKLGAWVAQQSAVARRNLGPYYASWGELGLFGRRGACFALVACATAWPLAPLPAPQAAAWP